MTALLRTKTCDSHFEIYKSALRIKGRGLSYLFWYFEVTALALA